jgi:hypothetical protein
VVAVHGSLPHKQTDAAIVAATTQQTTFLHTAMAQSYHAPTDLINLLYVCVYIYIYIYNLFHTLGYLIDYQ